MRTEQSKRRTFLTVILLAAAALYVIFILRTSFQIKGQTYFTLVDDAMISMRYAQHLAHGQGLVWNIGESPVEGFTNPAWTFYMAFWHLFPLSGSQISLIVMSTGILILLGNVLVIYRLIRILAPEEGYAATLAAAITAFYFPLIFWSLRGMEVGLLTLLVDLSLLTTFQFVNTGQRSRLIVLSALFLTALATRLDVLLPILLLIAYLWWKSSFKLQEIAWPLLTVIFGTLVILWLQHAYFGDFLPNTYYQKVTGVAIIERVKNGVLFFYRYALHDVWMPALTCVLGLVFLKDLRKSEFFLLFALFLAQCSYSVWVGGDYADVELNAANRFITQGMPALFILFGLVCDRVLTDLWRAQPWRVNPAPAARYALTLGLVAISLLVISGGPWFRWQADNAPLLQADIRRVKLGLFIAQYTSPGATIAVHAAGQVPYYSQRRTIDLLGLNDPVVAREPASGPFYPGHDKWDYAYSILHLKPDLIADRWIKLGPFMKDVKEYRELDNGMYVRKDSTLLDISGLSQEYR